MSDVAGSEVVAARAEYLPFGDLLPIVPEPDGTLDGSGGLQFTGKELDESGYYDFGSRYYSAESGRFIQPDTVIPGATAQSYNRYSYVENRPLAYVDPSGHNAIPTGIRVDCQHCSLSAVPSLPDLTLEQLLSFSVQRLPQSYLDRAYPDRLYANTLPAPDPAGDIFGASRGRMLTESVQIPLAMALVGPAAVAGTFNVIGSWNLYQGNYDAALGAYGIALSAATAGYGERSSGLLGGGGRANALRGSAWEKELVAGYEQAGFQVIRHPGSVLTPYGGGLRNPDLAIYYRGRLVEFVEAKASPWARYSRTHRLADNWIEAEWGIPTSVVRKSPSGGVH